VEEQLQWERWEGSGVKALRHGVPLRLGDTPCSLYDLLVFYTHTPGELGRGKLDVRGVGGVCARGSAHSGAAAAVHLGSTAHLARGQLRSLRRVSK
jgi:hypothetical protein